MRCLQKTLVKRRKSPRLTVICIRHYDTGLKTLIFPCHVYMCHRQRKMILTLCSYTPGSGPYIGCNFLESNLTVTHGRMGNSDISVTGEATLRDGCIYTHMCTSDDLVLCIGTMPPTFLRTSVISISSWILPVDCVVQL